MDQGRKGDSLNDKSVSRRNWLRASAVTGPALASLASCQPPVRQKQEAADRPHRQFLWKTARRGGNS